MSGNAVFTMDNIVTGNGNHFLHNLASNQGSLSGNAVFTLDNIVTGNNNHFGRLQNLANNNDINLSFTMTDNAHLKVDNLVSGNGNHLQNLRVAVLLI